MLFNCYLKEILVFKKSCKVYWYLIYTIGYKQKLIYELLIIRTSYLGDNKSSNVFEYLKLVASANLLGKE